MKTNSRGVVIPAVYFVALLALAGCAGIRTSKGGALNPPRDAASSSSINTSEERQQTIIPANTQIVMEKKEATATTPAESKLTIIPPTEIIQTITKAIESATISAPRIPDKAVEMKKAEDAAREPLLYLGIGLIVAGLVVAFVLKFPVIGIKISVLGGGGAIAAWKIAAVPNWLWGAGLLLAGVGYAFYTRGKWDADGDMVPDFMEKKPPAGLP